MSLNVLILCETSGRIRRAFGHRGHHAVSVDVLPADDHNVTHHYQEDAFAFLVRQQPGDWDLIIAHPPCTYLANSGVSWLHKDPERWDRMLDAAQFFATIIWECRRLGARYAVENPVMHGYGRNLIEDKTGLPNGARPDFTTQPYEFGEDASKLTCWWTGGTLPALKPTQYVQPRIVEKDGKTYHRWGNQTDSGQNRLPPSKDRWKQRSATYRGIAEAIADQWGRYCRK